MAQQRQSGVYLNEEDAQRLQAGIESISSILSSQQRDRPTADAGSSGSGLSGSGPSTSGSQVNCDRALEVVRNVRDRLRGNTHDEQKRNFAPYGVGKKRKMGVSTFTPASRKKECVSWSPRFVWLSDKDARSVPCTVASKEVLVEAGLGEKKVDILDVDCSPQEFHDQLIVVFPKCGEVTRETAYSRMTEQ